EKEIAKVLTKRTDLEEKRSYKTMRKYRRVIAKKLELDVPRPKPKEYLDRFASKLELSKEVRSKAHKMCNKIPKKFKSRKASFLVAASVIYNSGKEVGDKAKIREIAEEIDVGVSSLSMTAKKIRELLPDSEE
ncbi:hypothetical protein AKJ52_01560, partial [candidate division MSBL1 archaeon SCGC-AAA382C18]